MAGNGWITYPPPSYFTENQERMSVTVSPKKCAYADCRKPFTTQVNSHSDRLCPGHALEYQAELDLVWARTRLKMDNKPEHCEICKTSKTVGWRLAEYWDGTYWVCEEHDNK